MCVCVYKQQLSDNSDYLFVHNYVFDFQFWLLAIGLRSRVFANGPRTRGLIAYRVIPKTKKMVLVVVSEK